MAGLASGLPLTPQEVWSAIEKDPHWLDWQEGRISPHDWHIHLTKRLGTSLTFKQFCEVWNLALDPNRSIQNLSWKNSRRTTASPYFPTPTPSTCLTRRRVSHSSASFPIASIPTASAPANRTRLSMERPFAPAKSKPPKPSILTTLPPTRRRPNASG